MVERWTKGLKRRSYEDGKFKMGDLVSLNVFAKRRGITSPHRYMEVIGHSKRCDYIVAVMISEKTRVLYHRDFLDFYKVNWEKLERRFIKDEFDPLDELIVDEIEKEADK